MPGNNLLQRGQLICRALQIGYFKPTIFIGGNVCLSYGTSGYYAWIGKLRIKLVIGLKVGLANMGVHEFQLLRHCGLPIKCGFPFLSLQESRRRAAGLLKDGKKEKKEKKEKKPKEKDREKDKDDREKERDKDKDKDRNRKDKDRGNSERDKTIEAPPGFSEKDHDKGSRHSRMSIRE
jgi:hypothetical protein